MSKCAWCRKPVKETGDVCDMNCYQSFIISVELGGGRLEADDVIPKDLPDQPWYDRAVRSID